MSQYFLSNFGRVSSQFEGSIFEFIFGCINACMSVHSVVYSFSVKNALLDI